MLDLLLCHSFIAPWLLRVCKGFGCTGGVACQPYLLSRLASCSFMQLELSVGAVVAAQGFVCGTVLRIRRAVCLTCAVCVLAQEILPPGSHTGFSGLHLPFIGFTFTTERYAWVVLLIALP